MKSSSRALVEFWVVFLIAMINAAAAASTTVFVRIDFMQIFLDSTS